MEPASSIKNKADSGRGGIGRNLDGARKAKPIERSKPGPGGELLRITSHLTLPEPGNGEKKNKS